jgi:hypothetical protein
MRTRSPRKDVCAFNICFELGMSSAFRELPKTEFVENKARALQRESRRLRKTVADFAAIDVRGIAIL